MQEDELSKDLDESSFRHFTRSAVGQKITFTLVALIVVILFSVFIESITPARFLALISCVAIGFLIALSLVVRLFAAKSNRDREKSES